MPDCWSVVFKVERKRLPSVSWQFFLLISSPGPEIPRRRPHHRLVKNVAYVIVTTLLFSIWLTRELIILLVDSWYNNSSCSETSEINRTRIFGIDSLLLLLKNFSDCGGRYKYPNSSTTSIVEETRNQLISRETTALPPPVWKALIQ